MTDGGGWLTPEQAGELVGMTDRHLLAAADRGLLPAWKFGPAVRFRPADVEAWAATDPAPPELPVTLEEQALADLAAGDSIAEVARRYDRGKDTIRRWRDNAAQS